MKFSIKVKMIKVEAASRTAQQVKVTVDKPEHLSLILGTCMIGEENY